MNKGVRPHVYGRKKKERQKKKAEELGLRGISFRTTRKKTTQKKSHGEGSVSRVCVLVERGKTLPAQQSLDRSWENCLGLCPLDTVPRLTALPSSLACLLSWLVQDQALSPPFSIYPPMPSFQPHPLQDPACFLPTLLPHP